MTQEPNEDFGLDERFETCNQPDAPEWNGENNGGGDDNDDDWEDEDDWEDDW